MAEQSWRGMWWLPDEPDETMPGTLYCAQDGRLRLELIGGFDTTIRTPLPDGNGYTVDMESRSFPMIHGVSGSERFTLIGTHATSTKGMGFFGDELVQQDLSPDRALKGIHLNSLDEAVFVRAHLQLERLLAWSARGTFDLRLLLDPNTNGVGERKAGTKNVQPVSAIYRDMTIGLRVRCTDFNIVQRPVANRRTMETVEWATLDFDVPNPVSFTAFDTIDKDMQDLLTLSAYAACGSHQQTLVFRTSEAHPGSRDEMEADVFGRQTYRTELRDKEKAHHDFLFTLADLDFPDLVPAWLALKDDARLGFNILFGLRYIGSGYVATNRPCRVGEAAQKRTS